MTDTPKRDATIIDGIEMILRRACEESGIPILGPWEIFSYVEADLEEKTLKMFFELRHRPDLAPSASAPELKVM